MRFRIKHMLLIMAFVAMVATITSRPPTADFVFSLDPKSRIIVTNLSDKSDVKLFGVEFRSSTGQLTYKKSKPFPVVLGPSATYIPIADPNGDVTISDSLAFDIGYAGNPMRDDLEITLYPVSGQGFAEQCNVPFALSRHSHPTNFLWYLRYLRAFWFGRNPLATATASVAAILFLPSFCHKYFRRANSLFFGSPKSSN